MVDVELVSEALKAIARKYNIKDDNYYDLVSLALKVRQATTTTELCKLGQKIEDMGYIMELVKKPRLAQKLFDIARQMKAEYCR